MTDRELLEYAAKAAEYKINKEQQALRDKLIDAKTASLWINSESTAWNPLTNDGDALRLAVKLCMGIEIWSTTTCIDHDEFTLNEKHGEDKYSATRRAITRAAAEIGKGME